MLNVGETGTVIHIYQIYLHIFFLKCTYILIIVVLFQVILTLLEMSQDHFNKLKNQQRIEESDKAVIYYSRPFDIIYVNDRNTLIDCFMRLNNIEYK